MHPSDLTPVGLCECGCGLRPGTYGSSNAARGWVRGARRRFVKGHGGHQGGPPPIVVAANGCWEWQGKRDQNGYGRVRRDGRYWLAHRWVYSRLVGDLDDELVLDHLCRNTCCVNPAHLEQVTNAENIRRGNNARLTHSAVLELRRRAAESPLGQREFARSVSDEYGVAAATVRNAVGGWTWSDLEEAA